MRASRTSGVNSPHLVPSSKAPLAPAGPALEPFSFLPHVLVLALELEVIHV